MKACVILLCLVFLFAGALQAADSNLITVANKGRFVEVRASEVAPTTELVAQLDALYANTSRALGLFPKNIDLVVNIYKTDVQLEEAFNFTLPAGHKAFFNAKDNTIYISLPSMLDGVVAHEIGHVLVFQQTKGTATSEMQEFLAKYSEYYILKSTGQLKEKETRGCPDANLNTPAVKTQDGAAEFVASAASVPKPKNLSLFERLSRYITSMLKR